MSGTEKGSAEVYKEKTKYQKKPRIAFVTEGAGSITLETSK